MMRDNKAVSILGWTEESKKRRAKHRESAVGILNGANIRFESKNGGAHLIVMHKGHHVDFWPGTGLWVVRGRLASDRVRGRGIFRLVKFLYA